MDYDTEEHDLNSARLNVAIKMAATGGSVSGGGDALFEVGQRARVILPGKSRRCLVLCVGEEYDVSRQKTVIQLK